MVQMRTSFAGIPVVRAMITNFHSLSPDDSLSRAVDEILAGAQQDFPVVKNDHVVGILTRQALLAGLANRGQQGRVGDVMQTNFEVVEQGDMLDSAFRRVQECQCHTLPVIDRGRLVGILTMDNLGEFVAIQSALSAAGARTHAVANG
jgi:predicted transcriptional regulator